MAAGIRVSVDGADAALAAVRRAAGQAAQPRGLWDNIGASLVQSTKVRFERGHDPEGNPWPRSIRVQLGQGAGKTLIDTGTLMGSVTHEASDGGVDVGTNVLYAAVHQFGDIITAKSAQSLHFVIGGRDVFVDSVEIPARPFLGLDDDDEKEIVIIADEWLLGEKGAGANAS